MVRSIGASAQRVAAVVVGMSVAWLVGSLVGVLVEHDPVMLLALLIGRWRRLGDHGIPGATMVLLSLLTVQGTDTDFTYLTILETIAGGVIGVANAVVFALHIQQPRDEVRAMTRRVHRLLTDMAQALRGGWDADAARRWYDTSSEIVQRPDRARGDRHRSREHQVQPRHEVRPVDIDWAGYERTVETIRRTQWQVSGIARTWSTPRRGGAAAGPGPELEGYAGALDEIGEAIEHFGLRSAADQDAVVQHLEAAISALDDLGLRVRETPLENPHALAATALILDAQRLARELSPRRDEASVPTDSGPIRPPLSERVRDITTRQAPARD